MMKKDKNNQNINNIPKYLWGNYFKKPIKWLAHLINDYGNSSYDGLGLAAPSITSALSKFNKNYNLNLNKKWPTNNLVAAAASLFSPVLGAEAVVPDIVFDVAASIDEPSTSNTIHTIADFPETVAKFTPSKIDDYVAKGVLTLGNIDDAVSTSGRNLFSNFDKKPGKINNTADKTSVRESTNIRYRKNGGQIRKMLTASGGPINYKRWDDAKITSYTIPFIKEKAIKLTNAGRATGAVLSTNLLDSLADNAIRAGVPVRTAIGVSTKETTLGNPTDTKSAWNLSSGIRREFNGKYPGTHLHINPGRGLNERELVINYHKGHLSDTDTLGKSVILEALEFYKQHPDKYNTNQSDYQNLVNIIGEEVMKSPEILKWYREWEKSKAQIFRPEPYKINTNIQNTALEFMPFKKQGGYIRKMQTAAGGPITRYETLPNIEVIGYRPIELKTYKPLHKDYPFTGHSSLDIPIDEDTAYKLGNYSPYIISVDKTSLSKDYNLVTNNCADATLGALNYIFGTKEKPLLFTTPGDVRDYAINKLHGKVTRDKDGIDTILIPRNKNNAKKISKRALEWRKNKDDDTIYEFEYKQGGKMNILEFLKNGSGIHIKEKNKGKFTSYCGGKVTDECILKGKNSSNPAIRKRATFADNARHFKHHLGGIIKAEEGTKFNWQSALTNMGTNLFSSYLQSRIQNNKINSEAEAAKAENEVDLNQYFWNIYLQELAKALLEEELKSKAISAMNDTVINSSPLVTLKIAYDKASKSYGNLKANLDARNKAIDEQAKAAKSSVITDAISGVIQNGLGMLKDYYGSKNNNTSTTNISTTSFNNTKYKKFGTFNPDGSMNMLGGTFTIDGGYKPNQPQLFSYQPLKLNV